MWYIYSRHFNDLVELLCSSAGIEKPCLTRKRKVPRHIDDVNGEVRQLVCSTLKPCIELAVVSGYTVYCNFEELLLKGTAGSDFSEMLMNGIDTS